MNNYDHNLKIDNNLSYMIGLFQTDGSMSSSERNRGKFSLSLSIARPRQSTGAWLDKLFKLNSGCWIVRKRRLLWPWIKSKSLRV